MSKYSDKKMRELKLQKDGVDPFQLKHGYCSEECSSAEEDVKERCLLARTEVRLDPNSDNHIVTLRMTDENGFQLRGEEEYLFLCQDNEHVMKCYRCYADTDDNVYACAKANGLRPSKIYKRVTRSE